ncbi:MAG: glycosyltransferase [Candidatus Competibacteraceae bacterium]
MIASLHIIGGKRLGGAELFYARLVNALYQRGLATQAMTVPDSRTAAELGPAVPQIHVPMRGVWDVWSRWQIGKAIRQGHPDIVQTYMGRATRLTRLTLGQRPVHIARLGGYYAPHGYRHAHAWVVNSPGIHDHLIQHGFPPKRVFYISNFVAPCIPTAPEALRSLRQELAIPAEALIVVAVGRLHPVKGFDDLLEAFAAVPIWIHDRPVYLIIVGDGPLAIPLRRHAERLGMSDRLRWPGWRDDPGRFQELADLCVCSSRQEGVGNVILEAWARCRPVLSTRAQGLQEVIADRENGWLTPVGEPAALAQAMEWLLRDQSLRHELAANGRKTLLARHSEETIVNAYLDVYQRLLTGSSRSVQPGK